MFGLPNGMEWIILLVVILLLFGGKKIPELMRGVGRGVGELQKGLSEGKRQFEDAARDVRDDKSEEPVAKEAPDESKSRFEDLSDRK